MTINKRIQYAMLTILWMAFIFYLSSIPDLKSTLPTLWDFIFRKFAHITEFAVLYTLLWKTFEGYRYRVLAAFCIALLYAISDEAHQSMVVGRVASPVDVGIDTVGILFAWHKLPPAGRSPCLSTPSSRPRGV